MYNSVVLMCLPERCVTSGALVQIHHNSLDERSVFSIKGQDCWVRPSSVKEYYCWHSCCMSSLRYVQYALTQTQT